MIDQRSVQINQRTKLGSFLQKDHVINPQIGRREKGRVSGHQIVNMINHTLVNGHEVKVQGRIEIGQEVKAQKETRTGHEAGLEVQEETKTDRGAGAQEKAGVDHGVGVLGETRTGHEAEVQEETRTGHAVGVLKGKELEAEVQGKLGTDHKVPVNATVMTNKDDKKSNVHRFVFSIKCVNVKGCCGQ